LFFKTLNILTSPLNFQNCPFYNDRKLHFKRFGRYLYSVSFERYTPNRFKYMSTYNFCIITSSSILILSFSPKFNFFYEILVSNKHFFILKDFFYTYCVSKNDSAYFIPILFSFNFFFRNCTVLNEKLQSHMYQNVTSNIFLNSNVNAFHVLFW
jgi:hypothetical protein